MRLNTKQFESQLNNITKKINKMNNSLNSNAGKSLENSVRKTDQQAQKVKTETDKAANSARKLTSAYNGGNRALAVTYNRLRAIASTYLGIMGVRGVLNTSDIITSAQNKLNYTTANSMGSAGYNADGSYSTAVLNDTQKSMDKMYASAQKVRMAYTDMMSNVSKSMALAGDSFDNSTDRAIRFQEIMAEAYAIGGASAAEMSSSMYQLMQALGAGTLAGDELRSVREGAPLAYKAIEKFAQEVYNTDESLKELGSQGKITSDMVVEAIMNAGEAMDNAFAQTNQTFAQTWEQIKNAAIQAFRPVSEELREMLQAAVDNGMLQKFETFFATVAKAVLILMEVIKSAVEWIADNWSWLSDILILGVSLYTSYLIVMAAVAIKTAMANLYLWIMTHQCQAIAIAGIAALIYIFYQWKEASITTIEAICLALSTLGFMALLVGAVLNAMWLMWVGGALIAISAILYYFEYVCGAVMWVGATLVNIFVAAYNMIAQLTWGIFVQPFIWVIEWFVNAFSGGFNGIVGAAANAIGQIVNMFLSGLAAITKAVDGIAGTNLTAKITGWQNSVSGWGKNSGAANYKVEAPQLQRVSAMDAYNKGFDWGSGIKDSINNWGSKFQNTEKTGLGKELDKLGDKLGLDLPNKVGSFPSVNDPSNNVAGGINPAKADDLLKDVSGINDNTGSVADALKLTNEDLSYLRKLAETEWKKEYTTAEIKVEMNNSNTVNGETDLDGIVTKLSEKLYEEMSVLANGVYA
jgi:tape measure domain-containing protein